MPNLDSIISGHDRKILKDTTGGPMKKNCNCQAGADCCPVDGECMTASIVYKAEVTETASSTTSTYIGLAATTFKERYNNHISSFRNPGQKEKTTLSKHVWEMKERMPIFRSDGHCLKNVLPTTPTPERVIYA